jgi:7,8-dihydropterin-6-yl-methyl-4-(beta-D-ribofuranosyl)aminobenzene 5'-phosphate synthase
MVTVTVLADNTVATSTPRGLRGEWGFAAAVGDVRFDAGQTGVAAENARLLGVPTDVETVVLSHAHWDHTLGLPAFLDAEPEARPTVYCHPDVWTPRYSGEGADRRHIGLPYTRADIEARADVREHRDPVEVAEGVWALGETPRPHPDAAVGRRETADGPEPDPVVDDQALAVHTADGVALVVGCCHAGLRNTVEHAEAVTDRPVRHVVGGTHLVAHDRPEVEAVADWLAGRVETVAGTHCTGFEAQRVLADRLPDAFESVGVGSRLEFPDPAD